MPKASPERSCLGCKSKKEKNELLRFVITPERVLVPDFLGKLPGRGAYTCFNKKCIAEALRLHQFSRSFKGEIIAPALDGLFEQLQLLFIERILSLIALANRAGNVISGSDSIIDGLKKKKIKFLIISKDISVETADRFLSIAEKTGVASYQFLTKEELAKPLGKELRVAIALSSGGITEMLQKELIRYGNFFEEGVEIYGENTGT
ncbi:MAG: DUF448 domain-containing protein [Desulfuromonadales bacterium]|nr:DUF448 domain-containing protein [Desulfuromonadales bacterium]